MLLFARRLLQRQPLRLSLTVTAVALCAVMMQFLLAIYAGVSDGSVAYIRENRCDVWVLQRNARNLLRGTSFLRDAQGDALRMHESIGSVSPVLLLLPTVRFADGSATIFLAGYEPDGRLGGPPEITEGRTVRGAHDIVLDRAFARKHRIAVSDTVRIQDSCFTVCGLSGGTNAFVIQYGFVTLASARGVAGMPDLVSVYLVESRGGQPSDTVAARLARDIPGIAAIPHEAFLRNNLQEMESGFLPLLYAIAGIGLCVMTVILSLLLGITILERRRDFAIMKTLGAPRGHLPATIALLAGMLALLGIAAAALLYPLLVAVVEALSPEISTRTTWQQVLAVAGICILVSQGAALHAMRRLHTIYAFEVFR